MNIKSMEKKPYELMTRYSNTCQQSGLETVSKLGCVAISNTWGRSFEWMSLKLGDIKEAWKDQGLRISGSQQLLCIQLPYHGVGERKESKDEAEGFCTL